MSTKYLRRERSGQLVLVWSESDVIDIRARLIQRAFEWTPEYERNVRRCGEVHGRSIRLSGPDLEDFVGELVRKLYSAWRAGNLKYPSVYERSGQNLASQWLRTRKRRSHVRIVHELPEDALPAAPTIVPQTEPRLTPEAVRLVLTMSTVDLLAAKIFARMAMGDDIQRAARDERPQAAAARLRNAWRSLVELGKVQDDPATLRQILGI